MVTIPLLWAGQRTFASGLAPCHNDRMSIIPDSVARATANRYRQAGVGLDYFADTGEISNVAIDRAKAFARQQRDGLNIARDGNMEGMGDQEHEMNVIQVEALAQYLEHHGPRPEQDGWEHDAAHDLPDL